MDKKEENNGNIFDIIPKKTVKAILIVTMIIITIIGIFSFFVTAYFEGNAESDNEKTSYKLDTILLNIIVIPISLYLLYKFNKVSNKINNKILLIIIFMIICIIQIVWVINIKFIPESDQGYMMLSGANLFKQEVIQNLVQPGEYLGKYPFQIGFATYVNIVMRILKTNASIVFQLLNVIYSTISLFLIYKITKKLFKNETVNKIALLLILGFS